MSKNDVLYCKGMNMDQSESDELQNNSTEWDDTLLNSAYDRALKMANVEVARRLAMATNTKPEDKAGSSSKQSKKKGKKKQWAAGMPCRAIYEEDGIEYEAFVLKILNDHDCIVKFLGYDNTEQVDISTLKPSQGKKAQQLQIEQAIVDKAEESDASTSVTDDVNSDRVHSSANSDRTYKKKPKKKKIQSHNFELPDVPMPDWNKLRNMASMDIPFPMPPPPLHLPSSSNLDNEDNAVSTMLLAWYMSGYYTGLYQGAKKYKANKRRTE